MQSVSSCIVMLYLLYKACWVLLQDGPNNYPQRNGVRLRYTVMYTYYTALHLAHRTNGAHALYLKPIALSHSLLQSLFFVYT